MEDVLLLQAELEVMRQAVAHATTFPTPEALATAMEATAAVVEKLAARELTLATAVVQRLELAEGDTLFVRVGDPVSGWIPRPEEGEAMAALFKAAIDDHGLRHVPVVVAHYAVEVSTVGTEVAP